ncbi:MAG: hypothetical protein IPK82_31465 [Polyangiaceae bacterium]|nr:hypothetical protein [Polyangiaceae bacterium]
MTCQKSPRGKKNKPAYLGALGLTLAAVYTFMAALGGCGGTTWPTHGKLPDGVVARLHECGKKGPTPLTKVNFDLTYTLHVAEDDREAWVDEVMLINSTLNIPEVESCMADALRGMRTPLEALALRQHKGFDPVPVAPHSRALLGQAQAIQLMELMVLIGVGYALYTVYVHVIVDKGRSKPKPTTVIDAPAEPVVTAMPMATVAPTATTVPMVTVAPTTVPAVEERDRCKKAKDDCIKYCAKSVLEKGIHEPEFSRCLRACMAKNGC